MVLHSINTGLTCFPKPRRKQQTHSQQGEQQGSRGPAHKRVYDHGGPEWHAFVWRENFCQQGANVGSDFL